MSPNRLANQTSPYLQQHANNPVDWYPWGDEAFAKAKAENKPVLLSVGYSTCHWCHVMAHESFENPQVAQVMNEHYVSIKVDREERPDVDSVYMTAVQLLTGHGGWPMTVWLTPDRQPYFGGTYFPAFDGDRGARVGFITLLTHLREVYDRSPDKVASACQEITAALQQALVVKRADAGLPPAEVVQKALLVAERRFDPTHGGVQGAPKFPSSLPLPLLLARARAGDGPYRSMVERTLEGMARGGLYDQLAGGFHRYSTDGEWLVPHFEKMLYDNAMLAEAYTQGWQLTRNPLFERVARETLDYILREMTGDDGGFFSATDADSLDQHGHLEEGAYFAWSWDEWVDLLDGEAERAGDFFGVGLDGNFEGNNVLTRRREPRRDEPIEEWRTKLLAARSRRSAPLRDEKQLAAWNGLMISAFAQAGSVWSEPRYLRAAERCAELWLQRRQVLQATPRSAFAGQVRGTGFLEDVVNLERAMLDLFEATAELKWLDAAEQLQAELERDFSSSDGGYFATRLSHDTPMVRGMPNRDGAEPCGNSLAAENLLRLSGLLDGAKYHADLERQLSAFSEILRHRPEQMERLVAVLERSFDASRCVCLVVSKRGDADKLAAMARQIKQQFLPHSIKLVVTEDQAAALAARVPLVANRDADLVYLCEEGRCLLPVRDSAALTVALEAWA